MSVVTVEELVTKWSLNAKDFDQVFNKIDQGIRKATRKADGFGDLLDKIGPKFTAAGMAMSAAFTLPATAAAYGIIRAGSSFQYAMNETQAAAEATGEEMQRLSQFAKDLAASGKVGFTPTQIAEGMRELKKAGIATADLQKVIEPTLALAGGAGLPLEQAAKIQAQVIAGYGMDAARDAGKIADVFTKAANDSVTDVQGIADAFRYVGATTHMLGADFYEITATLGVLQSKGLDAGQAGRGLRSAIAALVDPTKEANDILKKHNIQIKDAAGNLRPIADLVDDFRARGIGMTELFKMMEVFGATALGQLISEDSKALRDFTGRLKDTAGYAERVNTIMNQGATGAMKRFRAQLELLLISIGESGLLQAFTWLADAAGKVFTWFSKAPPWLKNTIVVVGGLLAVIGPLLLGLGAMAASITAIMALGPALAALIPIGTMLATVFGAMWASFLGPFALVAAVIIGLIIIWKKWGTEIKAIFDVVMNALGRGLTWLGDKLLAFAKLLSYVMDPFGTFGMRDTLEKARASLAGLQMNVPVSYSEALAARQAGKSGMISNNVRVDGDTINVNGAGDPAAVASEVVNLKAKRANARADAYMLDYTAASARYAR